MHIPEDLRKYLETRIHLNDINPETIVSIVEHAVLSRLTSEQKDLMDEKGEFTPAVPARHIYQRLSDLEANAPRRLHSQDSHHPSFIRV